MTRVEILTTAPFVDVVAYGGALGTGVSEPALPFRNSYAAAAVLGRDVYVPAGTYAVSDATLTSVFSLARDNAGTAPKTRIVLDPGVTFKLSALTPRFIDFNKQADYDTFRNFELVGQGATIDANNIVGTGVWGDHVVIGCIAGNLLNRINLDHIKVNGVDTINVPLNGSGARRFNVGLLTSHTNLGEATQTTTKRIEVEDCNFAGGEVGVSITGTYTSGGAGDLNIYTDDLAVRRVKHDTGATPTALYAHANFHIGSRANCGKVTIEDCEGANSADVGIEIDGAQTAHVNRNKTRDSWSCGLLFANFKAAPYPEAQVGTAEGHVHEVINLAPVNGGATNIGYCVNTPAYSLPVFGHVRLLGCKVIDKAATFETSGSAILANGSPWRKITMRDFEYVKDAINANPGAAKNPIIFRLNPGGSAAAVGTADATLVMDNTRLKIAGTTNAAAAFATTLKVFRIGGNVTKLTLDIDKTDFDVNVTNLTVSGGAFYPWVIGETTGPVGGRFARSRFTQISVGGGTTGIGPVVYILDPATLTITPSFIFEDNDFSGYPANEEVFFNLGTTTGAPNRAKCVYRGNIWRSTTPTVLTIAAAATTYLPDTAELVTITGNTNITSPFGMRAAAKVTVKFSGTPTVSAGATQKLAGGVNFVATADDTLTVASTDGTTVYEVGRSVNA